MQSEEKIFMELMKSQFSEGLHEEMTEHTEFKSLKEWTSLQTMIVVNEIDQHYQVILTQEDFLKARTFKDLYDLVKNKIS